jgi:hypothetical protein
MKIYRRNSDGFEVQDLKDRSIEWVIETYGGEFAEVFPPNPPSAEDVARSVEISQKRRFLASTDYKIIRQYEQSTMSSDEFNALLAERQAARDRINELEALWAN